MQYMDYHDSEYFTTVIVIVDFYHDDYCPALPVRLHLVVVGWLNTHLCHF